MFNKELVKVVNESFQNSEEVIRYMSNLSFQQKKISNLEQYVTAVLEREGDVSTEIGHHIAIPHGESDVVTETFVVCIKLMNPIMWKSQEVAYVFMIGVPLENRSQEHLKILATLSRNLMREEFRNSLSEVVNDDEFYQVLSQIEREENL